MSGSRSVARLAPHANHGTVHIVLTRRARIQCDERDDQDTVTDASDPEFLGVADVDSWYASTLEPRERQAYKWLLARNDGDNIDWQPSLAGELESCSSEARCAARASKPRP